MDSDSPRQENRDPPNPEDRTTPWYAQKPAYLAWNEALSANSSLEIWNSVTAHELIQNYSEAIPSRGSLELILSLGPIIELGAGTGYWARLLKDMGGDVVATDRSAQPHPWTEVLERSHEVAAEFPERIPFVCWPFRPDMLLNIVRSVSQDSIALITDGREMAFGESHEDPAYDELESNWRKSEEIDLPHWPGRYDKLIIWQRR